MHEPEQGDRDEAAAKQEADHGGRGPGLAMAGVHESLAIARPVACEEDEVVGEDQRNELDDHRREHPRDSPESVIRRDMAPTLSHAPGPAGYELQCRIIGLPWGALLRVLRRSECAGPGSFAESPCPARLRLRSPPVDRRRSYGCTRLGRTREYAAFRPTSLRDVRSGVPGRTRNAELTGARLSPRRRPRSPARPRCRHRGSRATRGSTTGAHAYRPPGARRLRVLLRLLLRPDRPAR